MSRPSRRPSLPERLPSSLANRQPKRHVSRRSFASLSEFENSFEATEDGYLSDSESRSSSSSSESARLSAALETATLGSFDFPESSRRRANSISTPSTSRIPVRTRSESAFAALNMRLARSKAPVVRPRRGPCSPFIDPVLKQFLHPANVRRHVAVPETFVCPHPRVCTLVGQETTSELVQRGTPARTPPRSRGTLNSRSLKAPVEEAETPATDEPDAAFYRERI